MGNKTGITLEEALKMLEAANSIIQSQQKEITDQQIKIDAQKVLIQKKDEEISQSQIEITQINKVIDQKNQVIEQKRIEIIHLREKLATQLRYRFCAHSEKMDNQPSLFDFEDERFIPSEAEIESTVAGEGPYKEELVKSYKRRKCGRKKLSEDLPHREIYLDIPEEEKQCVCGTTLVKVGEDRSERLQVIPAQIYVEVTVRPKYACRNCEGSADEEKPFSDKCQLQRILLQNQYLHQIYWHLFLLKSFVNTIHIIDNQKHLNADLLIYQEQIWIIGNLKFTKS